VPRLRNLAGHLVCNIKPPSPVEDWTSFTFSLRDLHAWAVLYRVPIKLRTEICVLTNKEYIDYIDVGYEESLDNYPMHPVN